MQLKVPQRKKIQVSSTELIKTKLIQTNSLLPLMIQPNVENLNLISWVANHREWIETHLIKHGGLLFRNFNIYHVSQFEQFLKTISAELLTYCYGSTPRHQVGEKIYTSTEYPASQSIPLHNEMAYSLNWPMKISFFCLKAASKGGETPIADSRKIFKAISPQIKKKFLEKGVMYVRNYGDKFDLPWQKVFQTTSRKKVEQFCHYANIKFNWLNDNHLRTYQICQGVATHPQTGDQVWFNQAHLFHISSLQSDIYQSLMATFDQQDLPRNAYYGDGSEIEFSVLDEIREIYQQHSIIFPWKTGDILLLDNMLAAHGRMPYQGDRKVLVGMAESFNTQQ
ncbi:Taurine catabolism dioxygenase TauD/TfdA (plasmid) [Gloeothece citriformis PCC 7424]|uniref:Taurine catabolism dioxygenase TauD/TfdA n=1 Tax=Gloeothece citriformis (strain PCC 7424) TaxID=65393 RepID=B7KLZ8_GLOC7|nr:TauD/TfdA family dioxygenase [Gloeothece citriformis]ACK73820.1 Taurine catabolism dioxygenase TauD/TfdA [Gloeothece citriformis PCC 7424]